MAEQRYQAVLAVISDGLSVSQVCTRRLGCRVRRCTRGWSAMRQAGLEGLVGPVASADELSASNAGQG